VIGDVVHSVDVMVPGGCLLQRLHDGLGEVGGLVLVPGGGEGLPLLLHLFVGDGVVHWLPAYSTFPYASKVIKGTYFYFFLSHG